jgi:O-antigen ligase
MAQSFTASVLARLELWWNSLMAIFDAPVFGHGMGGFEPAYSVHRASHAWFYDGTILAQPWAAAGMAHNVMLQSLIEIGLIGTALALWFTASVMRQAVRPAIAVAIAMSLIGFPEQNPATALFIACALALACPSKPA